MKKRITEEKKQKILDWAKDHTIEKAAKKFSVSSGSIYRWKHKGAERKTVVSKIKKVHKTHPRLKDALKKDNWKESYAAMKLELAVVQNQNKMLKSILKAEWRAN